jgi:hypothetical protein
MRISVRGEARSGLDDRMSEGYRTDGTCIFAHDSGTPHSRIDLWAATGRLAVAAQGFRNIVLLNIVPGARRQGGMFLAEGIGRPARALKHLVVRAAVS